MLWDVRRSQETQKPEPMAELDGHTGAVTLLHMDPYKIVTGCPEDSYINVWEADTGRQTNSFSCSLLEKPDSSFRCSAMAANGCRIVTTGCDEVMGLLRFRDFTNATNPVSSHGDEPTSKFWDAQSYSDTDSSDD